MAETHIIQYIGFAPKSLVREYTFGVKFGDSEFEEYTLTIANEAFSTHRARYQDAPDICSVRLRRELADNPALPSKIHYRISDVELEDYRSRHSSRSSRILGSTKAQRQA